MYRLTITQHSSLKMKPLASISKTLRLLTLLLFACSVLPAQSLTETLQKQVWPTASPLSLDAWEVLLPAIGQDTLFAPSATSTEVIQLDMNGRPQQVILLQRFTGQWIPQSRTVAAFDAFGNAVFLQSWIYQNQQWENESLAVREIDSNGEEISFEFQVWEEAGWNLHYHQVTNQGNQTMSAQLAP
ncbi:MAG: hypothetical protein RLZZ519_877 [Bacteroidota bacterium]